MNNDSYLDDLESKIGRETYGIVNKSESENLKQTLIKELKQLKDTKTGEMVVRKVYTKKEVFSGPYIEDAPDLFVGFNDGFRASWQTALGSVPNTLIEDNEKKWSGDHLVDANLVPGIIFSNKKISSENLSIIDIAPTILYLFDIYKPEAMKGRILFKISDTD